MNPQQISDKKYRKAFTTFTIGTGEQILKFGDPEEWKARLGNRFLVQAAQAYKKFKSQVQMARTAMINTMIGNMVSETVSEMETANANANAERLRQATPKRALDTQAVFDGVQDTNAAARARGASMTRPIPRPTNQP